MATNLAQIQEILLRNQQYLSLAKIGVKQVKQIMTLLLKVQDDSKLEETLKWVSSLEQGAIADVRKIYDLRPPEWWHNVKLMGIDKCREIQLLNEATRNLKIQWRRKYSAVDKKKDYSNGKKNDNSNDDSEDPGELSVQSEQTWTDEGGSTGE